MTELLMRAGTRLDDLDETDAVAAQSGGPAPGDAGVALATGSAAQAGTSTRPSRGESTVALHGRKFGLRRASRNEIAGQRVIDKEMPALVVVRPVEERETSLWLPRHARIDLGFGHGQRRFRRQVKDIL